MTTRTHTPTAPRAARAAQPRATSLAALADHVAASAGARAAFGDAIHTADGTTIIPVASARWGFGAGAGRHRGLARVERGSGFGGGGGALVRPIGYLVARDGTVTFRRLHDLEALVRAIGSALAATLVALALARRLARR